MIYEARQQVDHYEDVGPALDRLSARVPLLALTNGNADLQRTGVARWFVGCVSAGDAGIEKPDARIFMAACERLSLPPGEVLHVGDILRSTSTARCAPGCKRRGCIATLMATVRPGRCERRDLLELADALDSNAR